MKRTLGPICTEDGVGPVLQLPQWIVGAKHQAPLTLKRPMMHFAKDRYPKAEFEEGEEDNRQLEEFKTRQQKKRDAQERDKGSTL